jgi:integrase
MGSKSPRQRARRGSAWFWKQTNCWYYTLEGGKRRVPLLDQAGKRIRGAENKQAAELALARVRLASDGRSTNTAAPAAPSEAWCVAKVCSEYLQACQQRKTAGTMSAAHCTNVVRYLNEFCKYAGALPVEELKRGDVQYWLESHPTWGAVTRRNILTMLQAAFNHAGREHGLRNPIKGLKKPPPQPRLASFSPQEEQTLYAATDRSFADFLFAAIHTGLRPFCELARLTADEVDDTPRGMLWRVRSPKTKRTRKIPIRPEAAQLARSLMRTAPRGSGKPLFRNSQGNRWQKVTGVTRFLGIKAKLGWDREESRRHYSCYTCRHTFAHRMLSGYWNEGAGCSIETLAELMGNTPKVAFDHYGKEWGQHYQEPLWAAMGLGAAEPRRRKPR